MDRAESKGGMTGNSSRSGKFPALQQWCCVGIVSGCLSCRVSSACVQHRQPYHVLAVVANDDIIVGQFAVRGAGGQKCRDDEAVGFQFAGCHWLTEAERRLPVPLPPLTGKLRLARGTHNRATRPLKSLDPKPLNGHNTEK